MQKIKKSKPSPPIKTSSAPTKIKTWDLENGQKFLAGQYAKFIFQNSNISFQYFFFISARLFSEDVQRVNWPVGEKKRKMSILSLPKDLLQYILVKHLDPLSWVQCLKAHRCFHVLLDWQVNQHYKKLMVDKKVRKWQLTHGGGGRGDYIFRWRGFQCISITWKSPMIRIWKGFCNHCGEIFRKDVLIEHAKKCSKTPIITRSCKKCHKWTRDCTAWQLYRHQHECRNRKWVCRLCGKSMRQDLRKGHLINECCRIQCPMCHKFYRGIKLLDTHLSHGCYGPYDHLSVVTVDDVFPKSVTSLLPNVSNRMIYIAIINFFRHLNKRRVQHFQREFYLS